jgi:hypothetical protein
MFQNLIFAAQQGVGIHFIDASDITDLQLLDTYVPSSTDIRSLTIDGDYLYAACGDRLLILHVLQSYCDRWQTGTYAQSIEIDTTDRTIENATVTITADIPYGTSIDFELSADGGFNWEAVTVGSKHTFVNQGNKLLWKATFNSPYNDRTARLEDINIDYEYNDIPTTPSLTDPGTTDNDGAFTVSWSASTDDGTIDHYVLQMSDSNAFTTILSTWNPTTNNQDLLGIANGTYYFRVRAVDDDGEASPWSNIEDLDVIIPPLPPIPGFPIEAIALGAILALGLGLVSRRRKRRKV